MPPPKTPINESTKSKSSTKSTKKSKIHQTRKERTRSAETITNNEQKHTGSKQSSRINQAIRSVPTSPRCCIRLQSRLRLRRPSTRRRHSKRLEHIRISRPWQRTSIRKCKHRTSNARLVPRIRNNQRSQQCQQVLAK